jgi:anti-sigma factor RsiW
VPIPKHCPVDPERAESYLLGNMPADEARAFEDHFVACPKCEGVVRFVLAMDRAAQRIRELEK